MAIDRYDVKYAAQLAGGVLLIAAIMFGFFKLIQAQRAEWETFKAQHECKRVGHMPAQVTPIIATGIGPNGQETTTTSTMVTPSKNAWACNDGVTYWR